MGTTCFSGDVQEGVGLQEAFLCQLV